MPYSQKAHNLFELAAHNPSAAKRVGIPQAKAAEMASEGIRTKGKKMAAALRNTP